MFSSSLRWLFIATLFATFPAFSFGGNKKVSFVTIPPGAEVEVNGSIACITPCSIDVSDAYFGAKHTVFSKHAETPITVDVYKRQDLTSAVRAFPTSPPKARYFFCTRSSHLPRKLNSSVAEIRGRCCT